MNEPEGIIKASEVLRRKILSRKFIKSFSRYFVPQITVVLGIFLLLYIQRIDSAFAQNMTDQTDSNIPISQEVPLTDTTISPTEVPLTDTVTSETGINQLPLSDDPGVTTIIPSSEPSSVPLSDQVTTDSQFPPPQMTQVPITDKISNEVPISTTPSSEIPPTTPIIVSQPRPIVIKTVQPQRFQISSENPVTLTLPVSSVQTQKSIPNNNFNSIPVSETPQPRINLTSPSQPFIITTGPPSMSTEVFTSTSVSTSNSSSASTAPINIQNINNNINK